MRFLNPKKSWLVLIWNPCTQMSQWEKRLSIVLFQKFHSRWPEKLLWIRQKLRVFMSTHDGFYIQVDGLAMGSPSIWQMVGCRDLIQSLKVNQQSMRDTWMISWQKKWETNGQCSSHDLQLKDKWTIEYLFGDGSYQQRWWLSSVGYTIPQTLDLYQTFMHWHQNSV